jgi:hypothetical protein
MSAYEALRVQNIASNHAKLASLGLASLSNELKSQLPLTKPKQAAVTTTKRPRSDASQQTPRRVSARAARLPAPVYNTVELERAASASEISLEEDTSAAKAKLAEEKRLGYRNNTKDGAWRGEAFGDVAGVAEGTVFGGGDYQSLGR